MNPLFGTPLLAFALSLLAHAAALRIFPKIGLLDFPERYDHVRGRIPYPTGIIPVVLFLCLFPFLAAPVWNAKEISTWVAVAILGITSFIDDRRPIPPLLRLTFQILVACVLFLGGARIFSFTNPLAGIIGGPTILLDHPVLLGLPLLSLLFTVFWLGLTVNALNWFDGIPGQVSALSVIGFLTIGFLSLSSRVSQPGLALLAFVLAGLAAGCLAFDWKANILLMGDTGAMFFGLMLGLLTIYSGGKVATAFLVLGVPLIDFLFVIGRRLWKRTNILRGNARDEHLHHRLLAKGWSRGQIVLLTAGIGAAFGVSALFLSTLGKFIAAFILTTIMFGLGMYSRPSAAPRNGRGWL